MIAPSPDDGFEPRAAGGLVRLHAPQLPFGGSSELANPAQSEVYRAGDAASMADAIRRLLMRGAAEPSAASLRVANEVRTDSRHYAEPLAHYVRAGSRGSA